jgi:hypothetical protein
MELFLLFQVRAIPSQNMIFTNVKLKDDLLTM